MGNVVKVSSFIFPDCIIRCLLQTCETKDVLLLFVGSFPLPIPFTRQ